MSTKLEKFKCPHCQHQLSKKYLKNLFLFKTFKCDFCFTELCYEPISSQFHWSIIILVISVSLAIFFLDKKNYLSGLFFIFLFFGTIIGSSRIRIVSPKETVLERSISWVVLLILFSCIVFRHSNHKNEKGPDPKYYPGSTDLSFPRDISKNIINE